MGRYRHVYARSDARWEIRHPEHGRICRDAADKHFSSEVAAATHLAKMTHVNIATLKTASGVQVSEGQRRFKYVFWHSRHERWVAKPPGSSMTTRDESGSWFTSQAHAAMFVVKQLGLKSVQDLSIKRSGSPRVQVSKESINAHAKKSRSPRVQVSKVVRHYKYVCWHSQMEKWVARPRKGPVTSCGSDGVPFKSEVDAAKYVVKQLGLKSINDLKLHRSRSPGVEKAVSQYHGVIRHGRYWDAIVDQRTLGAFRHQVEAADAIAERSDCSRQELLKEKEVRLRPRLMLLRMKSAGQVFQGLWPGDLESMRSTTVGLSKAMFKAAPTLIILSVQGKYGPWHEALANAWRQCGKPNFSAAKLIRVQESTSPGVMEHAEALKDVLVEAAKLMHMVNLKVWVLNCGRNVSHHSGPAPLLMRCNILDPMDDPESSKSPGVQAKSSKTSKSVQATSSKSPGVQHDMLKIGDSWYQLRPDTRHEGSDATWKLAALIAAGHTWVPAWEEPPRSISEWRLKTHSIIAQLRRFKAPGLQPQNAKPKTSMESQSHGVQESSAGYLVVWTLRTLFLASMHNHGICNLKVEASTSVSDLQGCFPDQGDWVAKLAKATGTTTVSDLLSAVGYTGPVELFTCYCCFLGDPDFDWVSADWLASHTKELRAAIRAYRAEHGQHPHPAVIVKIVAGIARA